jgi:hypothetical protein
VTIDKRVRLFVSFTIYILAFFFIIITFIRHSRDFSVSLFDQFCTSSLSCAGNHSTQCLALSPMPHINKSLIRYTHYIIFLAFIEKLRRLTMKIHAQKLTQRFTHELGQKCTHFQKAHSYFSIGIFVLQRGARPIYAALANKQTKFSQSILSTVFSDESGRLVLFSRRHEFLYVRKHIMLREVDNIICHANWVSALES